MLRFVSFLACAVSMLTLAAIAAAEDSKPQPCARISQISGYTPVDNKTVIVSTSPSMRYKVTFTSSCREMKTGFIAKVDSRPGVCLSRGDALVFGRNGFQERCIIDSIELIPPPATGG